MSTPDTIFPDAPIPDAPAPDLPAPDTISPNAPAPDTVPDVDPGKPIRLPLIRPTEQLEPGPRYSVLIHNDEVTTFEYVLYILSSIFLISEELADHIAWTAHNKGTAIVVIRPKREAETLAKAASNRARIDGFPLTFSAEEQE